MTLQMSTRRYGTFGNGHEHRNCYVEIETDNEGDAREAMFAIFDRKWAFTYSAEDFYGQPEQWNLKCIGVISYDGSVGWLWDSKDKGVYAAKL